MSWGLSPMDAAFMPLRGYAREHNRRLSQSAEELIDGSLETAALSQPAQHPRTSAR